jgi:excisionase family DNA binding protein
MNTRVAHGADDLDAFDIRTICHRSGTGRSYIYEEIRAGRLIARKFGRLTRVLRRDYEAWLASARPIAPKIENDGGPPLAPITRRGVRPGALR